MDGTLVNSDDAVEAAWAAWARANGVEAADVLDPSARGEVLRRSISSVEVDSSGAIADPGAFDAMRERLDNATAD